MISGGDGQFWTFGVGQPATATGIPVPAILSGVVWGVGDRLLVYSQDQRGQVYYLPRAELIGTVCTDLTRLFDVTLDYSSDVIGCEGQGGTTFWQLPSVPLASRPPGESSATTRSARRGDGDRVRSAARDPRPRSEYQLPAA